MKKYVNRFYADGQLADTEITLALSQAAEMYENGELLEVRYLLAEIIQAIDRFTEEN